MKKIFNYALLAAVLLVGVNVNAETIEVSDPANLQAAFDNEATDITIKITSLGVQFDQAASIELNAAKTWTLDLNGHDLVFNKPNSEEGSMFVLRKGILRVKNGNVINATPANTKYQNAKDKELRCFYVYGDTIKGAAPEENRLAGYSSQLYIEEGVFVDCTYGKDGIETYYVEKKIDNPNKIRTAFGVYVNIAGKVHGEKYGVQMTGNINAVPTKEEVDGKTIRNSNYPWYVIEKTAEVYANPTLTGNGGAGLYLAGYCIADIHGYVHGASGVYIKNGLVNIENAVIASDYTGTYVSGDEHNGSSTKGAGSAIVILSSDVSYGATDVTIGGDTKVTSEVGYAIEQDVTTGTGDNASKINAVHIEGGTYEGGTEGGVIFDHGTVTGGKVNIEDGNFTNPDVTGYLGQTGGATPTTVTDEDGNVTIVVSKPNTDQPKISDEDINGQDNLEWTTGKTQTMSTGTTKVGFFNMQKGSVTIKAGATFEITDKLIMGKDARIVVEPGATLISSGNNGIVAPSVENITIQTDELVGAGQFLFKPTVNSNKNTNATVQLLANSFTKKDQEGVTTFLKQRFGIPTHNTLKKITATKSASDMTPVLVAFQRYDINGWVTLGFINGGTPLNYEEMAEPFRYYMLQCANENIKSLISFSGEMTSNANFTLKIVPGWNTFANSYSGNMDATAMLPVLLNKGLNATVYVAEKNLGSTWVGFRSFNMATYEIEEEKLSVVPMQAFLLKNDGNEVAQYTLNYNDFVWANRPGASKAPRFAPALSNKTMAKISVLKKEQNIDAIYMLQADEFTADIENGYDAEKYMNENVNFYVNGADMKQQTLATNVLEGTYLGFAAKEAGVYTLSFDKMAGNNLVLVDLVNGQEIDMVEGAQYSFKVDANYNNDNRFMVKNGAQAPTAMDKVDAKANAVKVISDGQFRIVKNGRAYNAMGAEL